MAQELVSHCVAVSGPQVEPAVAAMRLYVIPLSRGGWIKRVFLAGADSARAREDLEAAMALIGARPTTEPWPTFLTAAISILNDAGFVRVAH